MTTHTSSPSRLRSGPSSESRSHPLGGRGAGALLACAIGLAACSGGPSDKPAQPAPAQPAPTAPAGGQPRSVQERSEILAAAREHQPAAEAAAQAATGGAGAGGEAPREIVDAVKSDLARRALVDASGITVVEATQKEWPNGALGCPTPGQSYLQQITLGYQIVLAVGDQRYDYRSSESGQFLLCDAGKPLSPVAEQTQGAAPSS